MNARTIQSSILLVLSCFSILVSAQQLKPTEILYSRMPTNVNAPPTGANQPTIWVVGQDGSNDRQITTGTYPRISDDGRFLLFKRFTRHPSLFNPFGGYGDFFIRELASGQETLIRGYNFDDSSIGHAFSPATNQGNYEVIFDFDCLMYKMNRDGTGPVFLYPTSAPTICADDFPSVRRGGDQLIAFHNLDPSAGLGGLFTVGINGSGRQKIPNTLCGDINPAWSNDAQFIGYGTLFEPCSSNFPQGAYPYFIKNLWKIRADGTGRQQLTNFSAGNCSQSATNCLTFGMVWTENNSKLIAAGRINGVAGLYAFNTDGSAAFTQIPITAGNAPDFVGGIVQPRVEQNVMSAGGGVTAGGNYSLVSTIGEAVAGITSTGGQYSLESGFWAMPFTTRRALFDYDGDGRTDFSVFRPSSGAWYLQKTTAGFQGLQFGAGGDKLTPADYDGDGKTDIAVYRPAAGQWFVLKSSTGTVEYPVFGSAEDLPAPGDFDGDGKADLVVFRPSQGVWYRVNSANGSFFAFPFGQSGDVPTVGDFDGDGKNDYGIFRPSIGDWYNVKSSNGALFGERFGQPGDRIAPADYDGDGKTDIAIFRPSTGLWVVRNSAAATYSYYVFGSPADVPISGDYDGDGKADIGVWRPSDGTWYIQRSSNGQFMVFPWGQNGDRPTPSAYGN